MKRTASALTVAVIATSLAALLHVGGCTAIRTPVDAGDSGFQSVVLPAGWDAGSGGK